MVAALEELGLDLPAGRRSTAHGAASDPPAAAEGAGAEAASAGTAAAGAGAAAGTAAQATAGASQGASGPSVSRCLQAAEPGLAANSVHALPACAHPLRVPTSLLSALRSFCPLIRRQTVRKARRAPPTEAATAAHGREALAPTPVIQAAVRSVRNGCDMHCSGGSRPWRNFCRNQTEFRRTTAAEAAAAGVGQDFERALSTRPGAGNDMHGSHVI